MINGYIICGYIDRGKFVANLCHLLVSWLIQKEGRGWGKGVEVGGIVILVSKKFHFIRVPKKSDAISK